MNKPTQQYINFAKIYQFRKDDFLHLGLAAIHQSHPAIAAIEDMIARLPNVEVVGSLERWKTV